MKRTVGWMTCALAGLMLAAQENDSRADLALQAAIKKETVDGDLTGAIEQYRKVAQAKDRAIAARALLRMGQCYEKLGDAEARKAYERLLREFRDQEEPVRQARNRLAKLHAPVPSGLTLRRIWDGLDIDDFGKVSPDGRYITFTHWENNDLALRELATGEIRLITHLRAGGRAYIESSIWSPDSKRIAYSFRANDEREIRIINLDGSGEHKIYRAAGDVWDAVVAWAPDGKRVLAEARQKDKQRRIFWIAVNDGTQQAIRTSSNDSWHRLSPDGRYIAFASPAGNHQSSIRLMRSDGSEDNLISDRAPQEYPLEWMPDGRHLLFASTRTGALGLWAMPVAGGKPQGEPVLIMREIGDHRVWPMGVTQSGSFYYAIRSERSDIYTAFMDPATGKVISSPVPVPVSRSGVNVAPRWSPDSKRIVYDWAQQIPSWVHEFSVYSFESRKDQPVARNILGVAEACWSADGESILMSTAPNRDLSPQYGLVKVNLITGQSAPLFSGGDDSLMRSCSNRLLAYPVRSHWSPESLKVRRIEDGAEKTIYKFPQQPGLVLPIVSHDSRNVAFIANGQGAWSAIMVVPTDGGTARELVRTKSTEDFQRFFGLCWSPDDRFIYFLRRAELQDAPYEMFRVPVAGGQEESTGLKAADLRDVDIAPDGRRIAFSIGAMMKWGVWAIESFLPEAK